MLNLNEFIQKYDDKYCEVGGSANAINQCVDLANAYIMEVLGKEPIYGTNAKDFWTVADDSYARIAPDSPPNEGDIVIWNIGSAGHIGVSTGIMNGNNFQIFNQNYPLKSPCHLSDFGMTNLIGYLRVGGTMPWSDREVEEMMKAERHDWLGQGNDSDSVNVQADMDAARARQKEGSYALSDFVHDRYKERVDECPAQLETALINEKNCQTNLIKMAEESTKHIATLTHDLQVSEAHFDQCTKELDDCKHADSLVCPPDSTEGWKAIDYIRKGIKMFLGIKE